jgi:hypothetical protein
VRALEPRGFLGKGFAESRRCSSPYLLGVFVITVCSRCKKTIAESSEKGSEKKVSHGICSQCLTILEGEIREGAKATDSPSATNATPLHAEDQ